MMAEKEKNPAQRFHSVVLDEEKCKGCTVCVTTCPAEAIRVRDGKARIIAERCIDCGECIRRCPHHAKKARADEIISLRDMDSFGSFDYKIALPAPSLYGQFSERFTIEVIHEALKSLGFDAVFPVSAATPAIAEVNRSLLDRSRYPDLPRPLITSSCPTIIKFIQSRFPTLIEHIVPVIAPVELAGRLAREEAERRLTAEGRFATGSARIGCFFISPCPGKITEAKAPIGDESSSIDGVFSMKDIHLPLLSALGRIARGGNGEPTAAVVSESASPSRNLAAEIAWGRAGGEAEATIPDGGNEWLAVDGMDQCASVLGAVENGKLEGIDFLELMACSGGCVGGALVSENTSLARHVIGLRERNLAARFNAENPYAIPSESCLRKEKFPARPALLLDGDYQKALSMMEEMERISETLPGLDCGCCGAPNCHALAEDIVRGNASKSDCVIILKEQYRELLERGEGKHA